MWSFIGMILGIIVGTALSIAGSGILFFNYGINDLMWQLLLCLIIPMVMVAGALLGEKLDDKAYYE
jgi:Na+/H+-dicarboxylate symporter